MEGSGRGGISENGAVGDEAPGRRRDPESEPTERPRSRRRPPSPSPEASNSKSREASAGLPNSSRSGPGEDAKSHLPISSFKALKPDYPNCRVHCNGGAGLASFPVERISQDDWQGLKLNGGSEDSTPMIIPSLSTRKIRRILMASRRSNGSGRKRLEGSGSSSKAHLGKCAADTPSANSVDSASGISTSGRRQGNRPHPGGERRFVRFERENSYSVVSDEHNSCESYSDPRPQRQGSNSGSSSSSRRFAVCQGDPEARLSQQQYISQGQCHMDILKEEIHLMEQLEQGVLLFNNSPEEGIAYMIEHELVEDDPLYIANFLLHTDFLDKRKHPEQLRPPFQHEFLGAGRSPQVLSLQILPSRRVADGVPHLGEILRKLHSRQPHHPLHFGPNPHPLLRPGHAEHVSPQLSRPEKDVQAGLHVHVHALKPPNHPGAAGGNKVRSKSSHLLNPGSFVEGMSSQLSKLVDYHCKIAPPCGGSPGLGSAKPSVPPQGPAHSENQSCILTSHSRLVSRIRKALKMDVSDLSCISLDDIVDINVGVTSNVHLSRRSSKKIRKGVKSLSSYSSKINASQLQSELESRCFSIVARSGETLDLCSLDSTSPSLLVWVRFFHQTILKNQETREANESLLGTDHQLSDGLSVLDRGIESDLLRVWYHRIFIQWENHWSLNSFISLCNSELPKPASTSNFDLSPLGSVPGESSASGPGVRLRTRTQNKSQPFPREPKRLLDPQKTQNALPSPSSTNSLQTQTPVSKTQGQKPRPSEPQPPQQSHQLPSACVPPYPSPLEQQYPLLIQRDPLEHRRRQQAPNPLPSLQQPAQNQARFPKFHRDFQNVFPELHSLFTGAGAVLGYRIWDRVNLFQRLRSGIGRNANCPGSSHTSKPASFLTTFSQSSQGNADNFESDPDSEFESVLMFFNDDPNILRIDQSTKVLVECFILLRPDIGYVEGMSHIAMMLLLFNINLLEAFKTFANLLHNCYFPDMFMLNHRNIKMRLDFFDMLFKELMPSLAHHFELLSITSDTYIISWFTSLFSTCLPIQVIPKVWDSLFLFGEPYAFQVAAAVLKYHEHKLIMTSFEGCISILHSVPPTFDFFRFSRTLEQFNATIPHRFGLWLAAQRLSEQKADLMEELP
ncbi:Sec7 domain-containing protein [Cryptosporidium felis]|nr:Sec7 domain-containing protein [Cryptosporidium felis]